MSSYTGFDADVAYDQAPEPGDILSGILYVDDVFDKNNRSIGFKEEGDQLLGYFEGANFLETSGFVNHFDVSNSFFSVWNDKNSQFGLEDIPNTTIQEIKDAQFDELIFDGVFKYFTITWDPNLGKNGAFVTEAYVDIFSNNDALWDDAYWDDQTVTIDNTTYTYDILFTAVASEATNSNIWTYFNDVEDDPLEGNFSSNAVPEPSAITLFSIGLLGLAGMGRRKK